MTIPFRTPCRWLLPALLLLAGSASAQVIVPTRPLPADPARAVFAPAPFQSKALRRTTALELPFFDDFTSPLEGAPKAANWRPSGGAFVSNRLAVYPLTRGAATLDGLKANGQSYSNLVANFYGNIDSLTSQPINLSGLGVNDQVYLSFAWQAGSIVGSGLNGNSGTTPVRLELYAKTSTGVWERVWFYVSQRVRTPFRQQVVALNDPKYLHGDFQFMFVASGNTSDNSDNWSVDYVLLDRGRTRALADTTFNDVATGAGLTGDIPSGGLRSPLLKYAAMPVWQFNAASSPSAELTPNLGVNLTNLSGSIPLLVNVQYSVRTAPAGPVVGSWVLTNQSIRSFPRQTPITSPASTQALSTTATPKVLRYTLALRSQETTPRTLANDTIFRDVELNNYYAYDDGTAENIIQLVTYVTGQPAAFAYRFDLNQPDYVRSLRLYPVFTASDRANRPVTINVWGDNAGKPSDQPIATKSAVIPNPLPAGFQYYEITFDQPVRVTGTFYVGYSQPSTAPGRDLHYGLDLNSTFPVGYLLVRNNVGAWNTVALQDGGVRRGALMMRPVMTNNVVTAAAPAQEAAAYGLYPNPTRGTVRVDGPPFAHATVLDALGRTVWQQPAAQKGRATLELPPLPGGVYTVRLTLPNGNTVGRRLMVE